MAEEKRAVAPRGQKAQGLSPKAENWTEPRIPDRHRTSPENGRAKPTPRPWQDMRRAMGERQPPGWTEAHRSISNPRKGPG